MSIKKSLSELRGAWHQLREPVAPERFSALDRVWMSLPESVRGPKQSLGKQAPGCGATYNVLERCNFSCTACYLASTANNTPPLPFDEVKAQLDALREHLGPGGNVQITAGEVTLLPVDDLTRIVRYALDIGLTPMVMTHGETFRDDPGYLETLMVHGGLDRVSIHIDTTQRGRRGLERHHREPDLHPLRDEFADLIRRTRQRTGQLLHAAHTFTVTPDNLPDVPSVVEWALDNADAFRMLSFQPTADVGRTRVQAVAGDDNNRRALWSAINAGAGQNLNPHPFYFGHPRCNEFCFCFVVKFDGELRTMEVAREGKAIDERFIEMLFEDYRGYSADGLSDLEAAARILGMARRRPTSLGHAMLYSAYRVAQEYRWMPRFLRAVASGRPWSLKPFVIVVHNFMSKDELDTEEGRERLDACTFRLPVDGQMVSMCEMNGTDLRRSLNVDARERLVQLRSAS
ncbi:MAG: radical SAM protein [Myxococcota bacterium]